jgi:hypothetical protein
LSLYLSELVPREYGGPRQMGCQRFIFLASGESLPNPGQ